MTAAGTATIFKDAPEATSPPEARGLRRDEVRLLVSIPSGHADSRFFELPRILQPGDLLVVNSSKTIAASLPADGKFGRFILNLSTNFGSGLWLAEPRWDTATPGPLPISAGDSVRVAGMDVALVAAHSEIPRLWIVKFHGDALAGTELVGTPIRYGHVAEQFPLNAYQTVFAREPGSAEMPSAGRPFSMEVVSALQDAGVELAEIVLHTGVSSLEIDEGTDGRPPMYPEPFRVSAHTARKVNEARRLGRRVIAVGTTVVRALESAWSTGRVEPAHGYTRLFVRPARGVGAVDGLLTGFHEPRSTHLAMLHAIAGGTMIRDGYDHAIEGGYLWHEFGDSHLILPSQTGG